MRRAHALRDNFRFDLALKDLKKLRELMHPKDSALQEVKKFHNMCVKGTAERGRRFPETPFEKMSEVNQLNREWITTFRACPNSESLVAFLKERGTYEELLRVFHRTSVPQCMYSHILETFDEHLSSAEDLKWAANFFIDLDATHDFESSTLLVCSEVDNVRMEKICRKIKKVDAGLYKKVRDSMIDQDWPDEDWD